MMTRVLYKPTALTLLAWIIATVQAEDNWIIQWNPNIDANKYSINQVTKSITINQGDLGIFKFEAIDLDTPPPHEPGDIDLIKGVTAGQVEVMIAADSAQPRVFGARDVEQINLSDCHPGWLNLVIISGDLGADGGVHVVRFNNHVGVHGNIAGPILASSCVGNFSVAGDVLSSINIYTISGSFTIHGNLVGPFDARTLANFTVNGVGPHTGDITVKYAYPADLTIAGDYAGDMSFLQSVSGQLSVAGDLPGSITVQQDVAAGGLITVGEDMSGFVKVDGTLAGQVRVNGSLLNGASASDIWIGTGLDATGAIAIDYDGWDPSDTWAPGAAVRVGASTYTRNTPAARVYEITECKGDMNNDELVDFGDINPFVLALSNPAGFGDVHPGLGGSMIYHGDANCDEHFDFGDINCFVALLAMPDPPCSDDCSEWSEFCEEPGNLAALPGPGETAAMLAKAVKPELYDDLVALAAAAAKVQTDPKLKVYWQDVHRTLAP